MRRLGLVQAGEQAVHGPEPALRGDDEVRPALAGGHGAVRRRRGLERADDGRADATTRPPQPRAALTSRAVCVRDAVALGVRAARGSPGEETPVCSVMGATRTPPATSSVTSSAVNGRPALGISALPGSRRVDVLVGGERPARRHVAVADRAAVLGEVRLDRPTGSASRASQSRAAEIGRRRSRHARRRAARAARRPRRRRTGRSPERQLDDPAGSGRDPAPASRGAARAPRRRCA